MGGFHSNSQKTNLFDGYLSFKTCFQHRLQLLGVPLDQLPLVKAVDDLAGVLVVDRHSRDEVAQFLPVNDPFRIPKDMS
jgi:hypothetical protein